MGSVAEERAQVMAVLERVEALEVVVETFPEDDDRRETLRAVIASDLEAGPPVRPVIAAQLIDLSERTVRNWVAHGILTTHGGPGTRKTSRLLLDLERVHRVKHLLADLRASDRKSTLIDEVYRRLVDATWRERDDLTESLRQMREGQVEVRVPASASDA